MNEYLLLDGIYTHIWPSPHCLYELFLLWLQFIILAYCILMRQTLEDIAIWITNFVLHKNNNLIS